MNPLPAFLLMYELPTWAPCCVTSSQILGYFVYRSSQLLQNTQCWTYPLLLLLYIQQLVKCLNNGSKRRGADCEHCFFKSDMAWTRVPWACCSFLVWLRALLICTESADKISAKFAFQHGLQPFSCLPSQYCRQAMTLAGARNQDHAATSRGWRIWHVTSWCHPPHPVSCV